MSDKEKGLAFVIYDSCSPKHIVEGLEAASVGLQGTPTVGRGCACERCIEKALKPLVSRAELADKMAVALRHLVQHSLAYDVYQDGEDVLAEYDSLKGDVGRQGKRE